jgi:imidazolonepropionase-like amidohydrolase
MRKISCLTLLWLVVIIQSHSVFSQSNQPKTDLIESGKFHLFIWRLPVGEENYTTERAGATTVTKSNLEYSYTQKKSFLKTILALRNDLRPEKFEMQGNLLDETKIDFSVNVAGQTAVVQEKGRTNKITAPDNFFVAQTPGSFSAQAMMVRYWLNRKRAASLPVLPDGNVKISYFGRDRIDLRDKQLQLDCYSIEGSTWGRTWLWFDAEQKLIAAVSPHRETSGQMQAVREGYQAALGSFLTRAGEHGTAYFRQTIKAAIPKTERPIAIVGGTLVDGTGKPAVADSTIIVQGNRIIAAGLRSEVKIPKGATIFDARGKTVLPGLWDMHAHLGQTEWNAAYLAAGVTTVRDVGNELEFAAAMRDSNKSGRGLGPQILLAGFIDAADPKTVTGYQANTPEEARNLVNVYQWAGFEQIKVWNNVKPEILKTINAEAHRLGMNITGHVPGAEKGILTVRQAVEAGQDQIEHISYVLNTLPSGKLDSPEVQKVFRLLKERGTVVTPTISAVELFTRSTSVPISAFEPGISKVPADVAAALNKYGLPPERAAGGRGYFELALTLVAALHKAGIPIVAGTDMLIPGHSLYRELELFVKAGLTPSEAIQSAAIVPARVMKLDKEVGTIEVGKRADLIVTERNPLENISNIRTIKYVVKNGEIYETATLWRAVDFRP